MSHGEGRFLILA